MDVGNSTQINDAQLLTSVSIGLVVLDLLGCILLSILFATLSFAESLNRRDIVLNNFLQTWILASAFLSFSELVFFSNQTPGPEFDVLDSMITMTTMVSTLNLSINVWFIMRSAFHPPSPRKKKIRAFTLVVTPYILALVPIPTLFQDASNSGTIAVGFIWLIIAVIGPILDVVLVIYYWQYYRKARGTKVTKGAMTLSFLLRLLGFGIYRLVYTALLLQDIVVDDGSSSTNKWFLTFKVAQHLFPILAFCILGLHSDILQIWLPCLRRRKERALQMHQGVSPDGAGPVSRKTTSASDRLDDMELSVLQISSPSSVSEY